MMDDNNFSDTFDDPMHFLDSHPSDPMVLDTVPTRLNNLQATPLRIANQKRCSLPPGYIPTDKDVVCGRGKRNWNHRGNINFRNIIRLNVDRYTESPTKNDKTLVVISIVDEIRSQNGRFLKEDLHGRWYDIGDAQARDKVGHSLRDQVSALGRVKNRKEATAVVAKKNAMAAPPQVMRRPSIQSDSGNEVDMRRSSHFTSFILNTFTRRPSFLAFSFNSLTSSQMRASTLMGGDQAAGARLEQVRRSSNWEFLDGMDDFVDQTLEAGDAYDEPLELSDEMHPFEVVFDGDRVSRRAQI